MTWLHMALGLCLATGWARWAAHRSALTAKSALFVALVPLLTAGVLSLLMLYAGLLGLPIRPAVVGPPYALVMAFGWWMAWRARAAWPRPQLDRATWGALGLLVAMSAAVVFNANQWPFYRDDAIGIYAAFAIEIAETEALAPITPQRQLYELYPQLMSMTYAYGFRVSGWANPYPARVMNALLSLAVLPTTYALARQLYDRRTAWLAVLVLAWLPDVGNWASAGYVDLPMAAAYTLGAALMVAAWQDGRAVDVALAGLMVGLAAWTKNAALLGGAIFSLTLLVALTQKQITIKHSLLGLCWASIAAFMWYARNLWFAQTLTPDTVWTEQASRTLSQALMLITLPQNYGLSGWVMAFGVGWGVWCVVRGRARGAAVMLLAWSVPYYLTWFVYASYDPRFVLLFVPFWAILGAAGLTYRRRRPEHKPMVIVISLWTLAAVLSMMVIFQSVEYKQALIAQPFASHEAKLTIVGRAEQ